VERGEQTDLDFFNVRSIRRTIQRDAESPAREESEDRPNEPTRAARSVSHEHERKIQGERDALVQRAAHGELFLLGVAQDLRGFARIGVVEICLRVWENVFVVRVDVDLAK
jgi:hypothetical protein